MADEQRGRVAGHGPCPNCGHAAQYKVNKKGHIYVYCAVEVDGGCLSGTTSRSKTGDRKLAERVKKWANPEDRKLFLGGESEPETGTERQKPWLERPLW